MSAEDLRKDNLTTTYDAKELSVYAKTSSTSLSFETKQTITTTTSTPNDAEEQQLVEKIKYPRAIPFIISNEFCERFNYYGIRTILVLYLTRKLGMSQDGATILYHGFTTMVYFCCVIGAIIADSWWGKFHTILWLSMVYVAGAAVLAISAIETLNLPALALTLVGLGLIAFGSGGIKPCVAAFGGEQFTLPQQAKQVAIFFSIFYFAINLGSFISTSVTPILREDFPCFEQPDCFSLGFGVPAALMAISIVIFLGGKFLYKMNPPAGNMIVKVSSCIKNAISTRSKQKATNPKEHWLEYAEEKFGKKLVMETKILLNVLVLYLPLPFFWALFDQQGSRWTFQATRMDGDLGFYKIKPDQMQVVNPFLILVFIPLYEVVFYPLLNLIGIRRPLQKLTLGGIFAGFAFLSSMFVELAIEPTYAKMPLAGENQVRIFNGVNCEYLVSSPAFDKSFDLPPNKFIEFLNVKIKGEKESFQFTFKSKNAECEDKEATYSLLEKNATSLFVYGNPIAPEIREYYDNPEKSEQGNMLVRILANFNTKSDITLKNKNDDTSHVQSSDKFDLYDLTEGTYELLVGNQLVLNDIELKTGGVYTIIIREGIYSTYSAEKLQITEPNSVSMLLLLPQYIIMTLGEVMYSVTGLQFSYNEAPESMRSVLQGCWQLTVGVGNLLVTIIVGAKFFDSQVYEFALFAGLMFVDMGIFMWLAIRYKSLKFEEIADDEKKPIEESKDGDSKSMNDDED